MEGQDDLQLPPVVLEYVNMLVTLAGGGYLVVGSGAKPVQRCVITIMLCARRLHTLSLGMFHGTL